MHLTFLKGQGFKVMISSKFIAAVVVLILSISQPTNVADFWQLLQATFR